ncbi:MAG TPA: hypothetical protein GYA07_03950 [Verrucomicrobia bacterium]|nr:hypothetical protein [Verrucomicrobiota bacterium]HOB31395.1 hypothetical protein [Verrucomicrobiota bacterium]
MAGNLGHTLDEGWLRRKVCIAMIAAVAAQFPFSHLAGIPLALMGFWTIDRAVRRSRRQPAARAVAADKRVEAILDDIPGCAVLDWRPFAGADPERSGTRRLLLRNDGTLLLVITRTHWSVPRQKRLETIVDEALHSVESVRRTFKTEHDLDLRVHAAIVFPNAHVTVARRLRGVEVIGAESLQHWISTVEDHAENASRAERKEILRRLGAC